MALVFLLLSAVMTSSVTCQDGALESRPPVWTGPASGMRVLFDIQNGFLNNIVQAKTIGDLIEEFNIQSFSDFTNSDFVSAWSRWIMYVIGFGVCIVIGILLAIILPCTGCCVSCFRCCSCSKCCHNGCCCCCKRTIYREDNQKWKYKRNGLSVMVAFSIAFTLASVVCSFIALGELKHQVGPFGILDTVLKGLHSVDDYLATSVQELDESLVGAVDNTTSDMTSLLNEFPLLVTADMGRKSGVLPDLQNFQTFANDLPTLRDSLTVMQSLRSPLQTNAATLSGELTPVRSALSPDLASCSGSYPLCNQLNNQLPDLVIDATYSGLDDLSSVISRLNTDIGNNIVDDVNAGANVYWAVENTIRNELNSSLTSVISGVNDFDTQVKGAVNDIKDLLTQVNVSNYYDTIIGFKPDLQEYGTYAYWGFAGVTAVCLLIDFCYFLGLILGLCLSAPVPGTGCCTPSSKTGSRFLLAGAAFSFIFSWLFLILTIVVFAAGGLLETNFCRHIRVYDHSMDKIEGILLTELANSGTQYNISLKQVALDCEDDKSLYTATNVEQNGLNISEVVDLEQYGILDLLDTIRNTTVEVVPAGGLTFFTTAVNATMQGIDGELQAVDLSTYSNDLAKGITKLDLAQYIADLNDLADLLDADGDTTLASDIRTQANNLETIRTTTYATISNDRDSLQLALDSALSVLSEFDLDPGLVRLSIAQDTLNARGNSIVQTSMQELGDSLETLLLVFSSGVETTVRDDLGACRRLYDAGADVIDGACVYFLDPVNTLWFCLGWFMFGSIFAVAFANELAFVFGTASRSGKQPSNRVSPESRPVTPPTKYSDPNYELRYKKPARPNAVSPMYPVASGAPLPVKGKAVTPPVGYETPTGDADMTSRYGRNKVAPYYGSNEY